MNHNSKPVTLDEICSLVGVAAPAGAAQVRIAGVASLTEAGPDDLSFLGSEAPAHQIESTRAAAVLVQKDLKLRSTPKTVVVIVDNADLAMAKVLEFFAYPIPRPPVGIDPQARVDPTAQVDPHAAIGPFCYVGPGASIGRDSVIHAQVYLGQDVTVGQSCEIFPNVTIRERITIGNRVIIHAGSVLGTDGFGYRWDGTKHAKIPQIGTIIIEDDVEIGSCVCIDRAKFSVTRVGHGTKIDNLVQIGHNVIIGPHCIIVGQAGLAGSATLGASVVLGGQVAVRDHKTIGDGAMVAACAAVADDIPPKSVVSGVPALPHRQSLREQAALRRLPDLVVQVRKLQEAVDALQQESARPKTP
jgi:UDP-3-O-[3-hydroxymyristoyl] glucosamine N-acyltransferase